MNNQQLTLEQLEQLNQISDPVAKRRFSVLFQLPQDLQTTFESEQTENSVWDIAKVKYNLPDSSVSKVARIIGLIFLGELPIKNFISELKTKLNIDVQKAQAIAQDINQTIFQPVRVSLMQVHGINEKQQQPPLRPSLPADRQGSAGQANYKQITNQNYPNTEPRVSYPSKSQSVKLTPPAYQPNYNDAQKSRPAESGRASPRAGREEVLNKIRQQQATAKPASFYFSRTIRSNKLKPTPKNRNINKYNSFFT